MPTPPPTPAPTPVPEPPPPPPPAINDAAKQACVDAAVHIVQLTMQDIRDPRDRASAEADRAKNVQRNEDVCLAQAWTPAVLACVAGATTVERMHACTDTTKKSDEVPKAGGGSGGGHGDGTGGGHGGNGKGNGNGSGSGARLRPSK